MLHECLNKIRVASTQHCFVGFKGRPQKEGIRCEEVCVELVLGCGDGGTRLAVCANSVNSRLEMFGLDPLG